ncbi:hypothetical protein RRG08_002746 [Elysia crispata]|uniref:Uncharacterized protein n=1 Tax=Elysia crispata TaxID=231223 RepID=A0AAE0XUX0_9GAST|nr:hypothetical protein RRG08_002746 [Elysia crispata]
MRLVEGDDNNNRCLLSEACHSLSKMSISPTGPLQCYKRSRQGGSESCQASSSCVHCPHSSRGHCNLYGSRDLDKAVVNHARRPAAVSTVHTRAVTIVICMVPEI